MKVVTIEVRGMDYAAGIGCKINHSGSGRYVRNDRKYWSCEGCGCFELEEDLAERQQKAGIHA